MEYPSVQQIAPLPLGFMTWQAMFGIGLIVGLMFHIRIAVLYGVVAGATTIPTTCYRGIAVIATRPSATSAAGFDLPELWIEVSLILDLWHLPREILHRSSTTWNFTGRALLWGEARSDIYWKVLMMG